MVTPEKEIVSDIDKPTINLIPEQKELQILLQKREDLIDFIWKEDGLPIRLPDSIDYDIFDKNFDSLTNLKKIDRITIEMKHGINSIAYLLHPKERQQDDLIIYHNGHGQYLHEGKNQIEFFLDRGYTVLVFSMPVTGMNSNPVLMLKDKEVKIVSHDDFSLLESDEFSTISYFVEPIAVSLNYIDKNFDFSFFIDFKAKKPSINISIGKAITPFILTKAAITKNIELRKIILSFLVLKNFIK